MGKKSEIKLWMHGIKSWNDFVNKKEISGIGSKAKYFYDRFLIKAKDELDNDNHQFFARYLPSKEAWRAYPHFKDSICYLDIETSGYYGDITVIGMYDGFETKIMVKGFNLFKPLLIDELRKYKIIVTFNGSSFDMPVIKRCFGDIFCEHLHIDLRHACSQIGLTGGLKKIEKVLGIEREEEVEGINGGDAVYLWQMWKATGNRKYIDLLVKYNEEDVINLKPLMEYTYNLLKTSKFDGCMQ